MNSLFKIMYVTGVLAFAVMIGYDRVVPQVTTGLYIAGGCMGGGGGGGSDDGKCCDGVNYNACSGTFCFIGCTTCKTGSGVRRCTLNQTRCTTWPCSGSCQDYGCPGDRLCYNYHAIPHILGFMVY